ncbi:Membrane-associated kinase regulator [Quillaja saponaria]|uniref:Membrane-associated kinase regulator n=1 Tax=Quillaja saponaria TaxID=32244 RepID=A0AAD7L6M1_QUISA|nr:Membrane-associated kinase regulator [Quillaja saponaria]
MEAFSLLKYWRSGGSGIGSAGDVVSTNLRVPTGTTTVVTAVAHNAVETDDDVDDGEEGSFFDLEFTGPTEAEDSEDGNENPNIQQLIDGNSVPNSEEDEDVEDDSDGCDGEREFNFTVSTGSGNDRADQNLTLSPSEDLFFKGKLVSIEPSSQVLNSTEPNSKPQFSVSLLKSATKFRVFILGLKKSISNAAEKTESNGSVSSDTKQHQNQNQPESVKKQPEQPQNGKVFPMKFKVEEVPIISLFTRDNSSRGSSGNKSQKQNMEDSLSAASSDEKRFSKEVMQKYLKKVKPLYVRVSKRHGDKQRFSGQLSLISGHHKPRQPNVYEKKPTPAKSTSEKTQSETDVSETPVNIVKSQKQGNLPAGLKVVCKHLGKSRSASSALAVAPSGPAIPSRRRDDSLLQQQDGIQSAILHCKRSFNASRDCESSQLPRSLIDSLHKKSLDGRNDTRL